MEKIDEIQSRVDHMERLLKRHLGTSYGSFTVRTPHEAMPMLDSNDKIPEEYLPESSTMPSGVYYG